MSNPQMILIIFNKPRVNRSEANHFAATIYKSTKIDVGCIFVDEWNSPAVQILSLSTIPEVDLKEIKKILWTEFPQKPIIERMKEWWSEATAK